MSSLNSSSVRVKSKKRSKKSKKGGDDESDSGDEVRAAPPHLPLANDDDNGTVASDRPLVTPRPLVVAPASPAAAAAATAARPEALDFGRLADDVTRLLARAPPLEPTFEERDGNKTARLFALALHESSAASELELRRDALSLLAQLAAHAPNVDALLRRGLLSVYLRLLHSTDNADVGVGTRGVACLALADEAKQEIGAIGGALSVIIKALYGDDKETTIASLRALRRLAELPANRDALVAAGAVTHVLGQVAVASDSSLVYEAMGVISNLARGNTARKALCAEKAPDVLTVVLARHTDTSKLAARALETLFRIAVDADGQRSCVAANAIDVVLSALDRTNVAEVKITAISLLHRLLREPSGGDAFAAADGIKRLWPWLECYWSVPRLEAEARDIVGLIAKISPAQSKAIRELEQSLTAPAPSASTASTSSATSEAKTPTAAPAAAPAKPASEEAAAREVVAAVMSANSPLFGRRKSSRSQDMLASLAAEADRVAAAHKSGAGSADARPKAGGSVTAARTSAYLSLGLANKPKANNQRALLKALESEVKAEMQEKNT
jgi:hypothetical protein